MAPTLYPLVHFGLLWVLSTRTYYVSDQQLKGVTPVLPRVPDLQTVIPC